MATESRVSRPRLLLHAPLVAIAAGALIAAFLTDLMYYQTSLMQWANFSAWLLAGGLVVALIAAILLLVDVVLGRAGAIDWINLVGLVIVAVLSIFNAFIHSRDAWTSVVPSGITLSAICAILLLVVAFRGWSVTLPRVRVDRAEGDRS